MSSLTSLKLDGAKDSGDLARILGRYVESDSVHPTSDGYELIAQGCLHAIKQAAAWPMSAAGCSEPYGVPAIATPPDTCAFGSEMQGFVLRARGWELVTEVSRQGHSKPGYVARTPGSLLEVCHRGRDVFQFAFLRSYEGMGMVRGECVDGCTCTKRSWDGHTPHRVSQSTISKLHRIVLVGGVRPCPCTIRLTVLPMSSSMDGGHKFKVDALFGSQRIYSGRELIDAVHVTAGVAPQTAQWR